MAKRYYLIIGLILCLALGAALRFSLRDSEPETASSPAPKRTELRISSPVRPAHPIYPYSVIPGGVYSEGELRAVIDRDPLVRQHYQAFNLRKLRFVQVTEPREEFVSFRKDNRIFWTRKRLRIERGELLLTDGENYARTRCGNRLSETPVRGSTTSAVADEVLSAAPIDAVELGDLRFTPDRTIALEDFVFHPDLEGKGLSAQLMPPASAGSSGWLLSSLQSGPPLANTGSATSSPEAAATNSSNANSEGAGTGLGSGIPGGPGMPSTFSGPIYPSTGHAKLGDGSGTSGGTPTGPAPNTNSGNPLDPSSTPVPEPSLGFLVSASVLVFVIGKSRSRR